MGRTITLTYRVEYKTTHWQTTAQGWHRQDGKPTKENLIAWIAAMEASCQPGGCNQHIGPMTITEAWIVRQSTGKCVALWRLPLFQVV
jgi:hypothetical protein